jgi:hypothetical protein
MTIHTRTATTIDGVEYAPGTKFRVTKEGARLSGYAPYGLGASISWRQDLHVGDVVTCTGFGPGWGSDPGYGVEFTTEQSEAAGASHCDVWPGAGGLWNFHPAPSYLEPLE